MKSFNEFVKLVEQVEKTGGETFARFDHKILIIGYGSLGQAILPLILRHIEVDPKNITVLEKDNHRALFMQRNRGNGVQYIKKEITKQNLDSVLGEYLDKSGLLIDVSCNIGCEDLLQWCFDHDVLYTNTSIERWADIQDEQIPNLADRTLYHTHNEVREFASKFPNKATAGVVSGANPGLVTHLTKDALLMIAEKTGKKVEAPTDKEGWAQLMKKLGVEVIQIAERDTQRVDVPKEPNEFYGTWSCTGMMDEGRAPAELGWGTHEPKGQDEVVVQGTAAYLTRPGVSVMVKSWVPSLGAYNGFLIQHSEAVTISEYFETEDKSFRPTVYYAYQPCDSTLASLHEFRGRELDPQTKQVIIKDEIIAGKDELGVLLITNKGKSYWYGSQLDIAEARELIPGENATSLQVVANMLGTILWMIENPRMGYVEPEAMDYAFILRYAMPYLGPVVMEETDWHPTEDVTSLFKRDLDKKNPNCLSNFRVWS